MPYVAKRCNVSASRLTALFQQRLSITPAEYIRRVKLEESKVLIKAGEGNFSEIASKLNYSTVQQFSRQFNTVVYTITAVQIRVGNQAFPAHDGAWLFKIGTHHDFQTRLMFFAQRL